MSFFNSFKTRKNDEDESELEKNALMTTSSNVLRIKYRDIDKIYGYLFASLWPLKEAGVDIYFCTYACLFS